MSSDLSRLEALRLLLAQPCTDAYPRCLVWLCKQAERAKLTTPKVTNKGAA